VLAIVFALMAIPASVTLAHAQPLDLQERGATLARKAFEELDNEAKTNQSKLLGEIISGADYKSHYNAKLEKCMMLITRSEVFSDVGVAWKQWFLVDAIERRYFATYAEGKLIDPELAKRTGQRNVETPSCELTPSIRQKTICKTRAEFEAFVAEYMEK
jgi:hypothetical protein